MEPKKLATTANDQTSRAVGAEVNISTIAQGERKKGGFQVAAALLFKIQRNAALDKDMGTNVDLGGALAPINQEGGRFLGILGRCCISGCDVHTLSLSNDNVIIARHFQESDVIPPEFNRARTWIQIAPSNVVAVLVYESGLQTLLLDGSTRRI